MQGITLLIAIAVNKLISLIDALIFIRAILSFFPIKRNNPIIRILYTLTEPVLAPIRQLLAKSPLGGPGMMLDFSPVLAFILLEVIRNVLISLIAMF